jgi:uncharacterized protein YhfF
VVKNFSSEVDMNERIEQFWKAYLATLPADSPIRNESYDAESWGDNPQLADELSTLIMAGTKTATCSALWEWEAEGETIPTVGYKSILLNGAREPLAVLETTEVLLCAYQEVDAAFARDEGEGDLSLLYWREAHWRFFSRTLPKIRKEPTPEMPLVCERFRVIYKP